MPAVPGHASRAPRVTAPPPETPAGPSQGAAGPPETAPVTPGGRDEEPQSTPGDVPDALSHCEIDQLATALHRLAARD